MRNEPSVSSASQTNLSKAFIHSILYSSDCGCTLFTLTLFRSSHIHPYTQKIRKPPNTNFKKWIQRGLKASEKNASLIKISFQRKVIAAFEKISKPFPQLDSGAAVGSRRSAGITEDGVDDFE